MISDSIDIVVGPDGVRAADEPVNVPAQLPPDSPKPELKEFTIRVPAEVEDSKARAAWNAGNQIMGNTLQGLMTICFPMDVPVPKSDVIVSAGAEAKPEYERQIGTFKVLLLNPADVSRIIKLAEALNERNLEMAKRIHSTGDAQKKAYAVNHSEKAKDNLAKDAMAKVKGFKGGIIQS